MSYLLPVLRLRVVAEDDADDDAEAFGFAVFALGFSAGGAAAGWVSVIALLTACLN